MRLPVLSLLVAAALATATGTVDSAFTSTTKAGGWFAAAEVFAPEVVDMPEIEGVAREGETLTATSDTWRRRIDTMTTTWLRCDAAGDGCVAVSSGRTRELGAGDVGSTVRVRVTAYNDGGASAATSEQTALVVKAPPPANTTPVTLTGTPTVGEPLTATDGAWTNQPSLARRWLRCTPACAPIPGETESRYVLTGDDAGATIKAEVTATNRGGTATSAAETGKPVARATFTHVLCANPDTGRGVADDRVLPDGFVFGRNVAEFPDPAPNTRCAGAGGGVHLWPGSAPWSVAEPDRGGWLRYRAGTDLDFAGATLYRHGQGGGNFSWSIDTATSLGIFATPRAELCSWGEGCSSRGTTADRFATANRLAVERGAVNGFNLNLLCDIPGSRRCDSTTSLVLRIYGGKATLRDTSTPRITSTPTGSLASDEVLGQTAQLTFNAADSGSGLYRLRITLDGETVHEQAAHGAGSCADVNPANDDPYEFAVRQPCATSLGASYGVSTLTWPRGRHRLRVTMEDAGRNTTVVVNRMVTVDG